MSSSPHRNAKLINSDAYSHNYINEKGGRQTPSIKSNPNSFAANKATISRQQQQQQLQQQHQQQVQIDPLEEMRKIIGKILTESNEHISVLSGLCSIIDMELEETYSKVQEEYSKRLDSIYNERMMKIDELNDKYEYDTYKVIEYYKTINEDDPNSIKYNSIVKEKNEQLKIIDDEFKTNKTKLEKDYEDNIAIIDRLSEEKRSDMNQSEFFDKMKKRINTILDAQPVIKTKKDGGNSNKGISVKK